MAIQQLASSTPSGIMNFLFQDDGNTDGMVLEGPEFAQTLHQLLGEYEHNEAATPEAGVTTLDTPELAATDQATQVLAELAGKAPLSTALDALTTDFALPAQSAALPAEATWEGNAEGQEIEQQFWGIAPFTDVMAALQQHAAAPNTTNLTQSAGTIETPATTATTPAANDSPSPAPQAPVFGNGIAQVIELARDVSQAAAELTRQPAQPAQNPGRNAPASGKPLPLNFRPAVHTQNFRAAPNTLNQVVTTLHARAAQITAMTDAQPYAGPDTNFTTDLIGTEPRSPQAATPVTPNLLQGLHALHADSPLLNPAKPAALDATATGASLQLQSPHLAGTDAWLEDLGTRVDWLKDLNIQKADLQLHPAELGLLEIHIAIGDDTTTVAFVTHNAAARELIEANMPRLRDLLASQGMQLDQSHVSQHSAEGQRRDQDTNTGASAAQRDKATTEENAPVRRTVYLADPNRIDHYV